MEYKVCSFFINDINQEQSYVMNSEVISTLDDCNLISLCHWIDTNQINKLSEKDIKHFMGNASDDAKEFMLSQGLIKPIKEQKYSKFIYLTNDLKIFDSAKFNLDLEENENIYQIEFYNELGYLNMKEGTIAIFILNPFSINMLKMIVKFSKKYLVNVRVAFFYNFKFYITNIYSPKDVTPCPLCFFYNLETSLRTTNRFEDEVTFQNLVDIIYSQNMKFVAYAGLKNTMILPLLSLMSELEQKSTFNDTYELDYHTGKISTDIANHWELCDCYES